MTKGVWFVFVLLDGGPNIFSRAFKDKIEATEDCEGKDDATIFGLLVVTTKKIGDGPDEIDLFGEIVHGHLVSTE